MWLRVGAGVVEDCPWLGQFEVAEYLLRTGSSGPEGAMRQIRARLNLVEGSTGLEFLLGGGGWGSFWSREGRFGYPEGGLGVVRVRERGRFRSSPVSNEGEMRE